MADNPFVPHISTGISTNTGNFAVNRQALALLFVLKIRL